MTKKETSGKGLQAIIIFVGISSGFFVLLTLLNMLGVISQGILAFTNLAMLIAALIIAVIFYTKKKS